MESQLVRLCVESACRDRGSVDKWRLQRRTLDRMPSHLAQALLRCLLRRRLLYPSLLEAFKICIEEVDLRREVLVDAEWLAYIGGFRFLCCLNVADCHRITNSALWAIAGLSSLKEVDLSRCVKVTDAGIKHLLSLSSLEKLSISETGVTAEGVSLLGSLSNLSELDVGGLPVTDQTLISLQHLVLDVDELLFLGYPCVNVVVLKNLQHLNLWGGNITNSGAVMLSMFPRLSFLNLAWTKVTELPSLPSLEYLNMSNCVIRSILGGCSDKAPLSKLVIAGATLVNEDEVFMNIETSLLIFLDMSCISLKKFWLISYMGSLEHLDLSSSGIKDNSVQLIAHIGSNLRYLNLSNTEVTSAGLAVIAGQVPKLEVFLISHTQIDDFAIVYIGMMSGLKVLDLSYTNIRGFITEEIAEADKHLSLAALQSLKLERLNIEQTFVRDDALLPLCDLTELRHLSLKNKNLTDLSLHLLSPLQKLETLGFHDAVLTAHGLELYKPSASLKVMDLMGCWLLSEDALKEFHRKHPRIELRHELVHMLPMESQPSRSQYKSRPNSKSYVRNRSPEKLALSQYFIDQRLKYNKEELLALRYSTLSVQLSNKDSAFFKVQPD